MTDNTVSFSKARLLIDTIQKLSMAKSHEAIRDIVKQAARQLVGSDGATFVLRDKDHCYYVDEDAIEPLWKGQRFPIEMCISGWVMLHKKPTIIPDIYQDERIPIDAYRPTFVKSLTMVPIRTLDPIGAIGNYWQTEHQPSEEDVELLQALADSTSIAMENVNVYLQLEERIQERTHELQLTNEELEAFSYSVSHDLKSPLRAINGYTALLSETLPDLSDDNKLLFDKIVQSTDKMSSLIQDLLNLSRVNQIEINYTPVNIAALSRDIFKELAEQNPMPTMQLEMADDIIVQGDEKLIRILLQNLLSNAYKFSSKKEHPLIQVLQEVTDDKNKIMIIDNGAGFDMQQAAHLFEPFKRLHSDKDFPGSGIGLAIVKRIMTRHHGDISVHAELDKGATFTLTFPKEMDA